jgi:hypothetical protein
MAEAKDLAQSGHAPEALTLVQSALTTLSSLPPARPGVTELRDDLETLRDQLARTDDDRDDANDAARPPSLKPVQPERNERTISLWLMQMTVGYD